MELLRASFLLLASLAATQAWAWGNHALASYRAFEKMPEVVSAPAVVAEPLEAFLKAEENTIEALLASHEAWARANLERYPARPDALAFSADAQRSDEARRLSFLSALRIAPNSKFALYLQADPSDATVAASYLPKTAVSTLAEHKGVPSRYVAIRSGDSVAALAVVATATEEPDYGLDIHLWEDSPSEWGRRYGFGPQPYGFASHANASQAPLRMAFMQENRALYVAAPNLKRSLVLLRFYQFSTLSSLAFRTGHGYWGWRFAGLSLHYLQELTHPFQTHFAPGISTAKLLASNALAAVGIRGMRDELVLLLANRQAVLKKYQTELLARGITSKQDGALEKALRAVEKDKNYPDWSDRYVRDVVITQSYSLAPALVQQLITTMPEAYVADARFDFCAQQADINLLGELTKKDANERGKLETSVAELMGNMGIHSRNALRGILRDSNPP